MPVPVFPATTSESMVSEHPLLLIPPAPDRSTHELRSVSTAPPRHCTMSIGPRGTPVILKPSRVTSTEDMPPVSWRADLVPLLVVMSALRRLGLTMVIGIIVLVTESAL